MIWKERCLALNRKYNTITWIKGYSFKGEKKTTLNVAFVVVVVVGDAPGDAVVVQIQLGKNNSSVLVRRLIGIVGLMIYRFVMTMVRNCIER